MAPVAVVEAQVREPRTSAGRGPRAVLLALAIAAMAVVGLAGCTLDDQDGPGDGDASTAGAPVAQVCGRLCRHFVTCLQAPESEAECRMGCETDLSDCTPAELARLDGCSEVACAPGDAEAVSACIQQVACVSSGVD